MSSNCQHIESDSCINPCCHCASSVCAMAAVYVYMLEHLEDEAFCSCCCEQHVHLGAKKHLMTGIVFLQWRRLADNTLRGVHSSRREARRRLERKAFL